jgi:hypothetical protein
VKVMIYSVYDSKAEAFMLPQFYQTKGIAIRAFVEAVNTEGTPFNKYPADFTMFELGSFEDNECKFEVYDTPKSIGLGIEFVKSE